MGIWKPLNEAERARYYTINEDNLEFLKNRKGGRAPTRECGCN
jgi:hypothetical protein